jgi:NADH-quinone oxidoreductase subunit N
VIQSIDHVALLPLYASAGAALLVLIADLVTGRRGHHDPVRFRRGDCY